MKSVNTHEEVPIFFIEPFSSITYHVFFTGPLQKKQNFLSFKKSSSQFYHPSLAQRNTTLLYIFGTSLLPKTQ